MKRWYYERVTRGERWLEHGIERVGLTTMVLMRSSSRWRRALRTLIGASAVTLMIPVLVLWIVVGKKP